MSGALFHKASLRQHGEVFLQNSQKVCDRLEELSKAPSLALTGIDMQDFCMRFTLDSFAEVCFGVSLNSIDNDSNPFANAFDVIQTVSQRRGRKGFLWPYIEMMFPERDYHEKLLFANELVNSIVQERQNQEDFAGDALSQVLKEASLSGKPYLDSELRDFVMNFLLAGR
jgi:cytochrome P450